MVPVIYWKCKLKKEKGPDIARALRVLTQELREGG